MSGSFSALTRLRNLERLGSETFDLLVVGGGITGAGVARAAARRGLKVALAEREDFAGGTSGRSSKLIHGGLRYLAQGEVALVREAARERAVLHRQAPHLVRPTPALLPVWEPESVARIRLGLALYDWLAGVPPALRRRFLDPDTAVAAEPWLRRRGLKAAGSYWEFVTDDARLTLEVVLAAHRSGAVVANHAPAVELLLAGGRAGRRVAGAAVADALTGRRVEVRAAVVVNAAGPWLDGVRALAGPLRGKALRVTKGAHLAFPRTRLPVGRILFVPGPDRRPVFIVPYGDWTFVGTTDTDYTGPLETPAADANDVAYLLAAANTALPEARLGAGDVTATWAGLRPLIHQPGKPPARVSRRDEVWHDPPGLLSVAGGKLTTYRRMAGRVLARALDAVPAASRLPAGGRWPPEGPLPGGEVAGGPAGWPARARELGALAERLGLHPVAARRLAGRYGSRAEGVLDLVRRDPALARPLAPGCQAVAAEVVFAVAEEMALTLADVLDRRLGLLCFDAANGLDAAPAAAEIMASILGWDAARRQAELEAYRKLVGRHQAPPVAGAAGREPKGVAGAGQTGEAGSGDRAGSRPPAP